MANQNFVMVLKFTTVRCFQISAGDNLHEMSKPIFWENSEKNVSECRLLHHENFDPLKPQFYSKTMVYRGIHYFSYLAKKT